MTSRPLSRWLAPLALLAALGAVFLVISAARDSGDSGGDTPTTTSTEERRETRGGGEGGDGEQTGTGERKPTKRRTYTVKPGDTLALISEQTGVSVDELLELNPDIDANSLTVGDKIKLAE